MKSRFFLLPIPLCLLFSFGGAFAAEEKPAKPVAKSSVVKVQAGATAKSQSEGAVSDAAGSETSDADQYREKQKAMDDVNAFLIESYKIKLDKTLAEVYQSVRVAAKDDHELQSLLLKRILSEIETKIEALSGRSVSPNRKKILLAVFAYMKSDVESKIRSLEEK